MDLVQYTKYEHSRYVSRISGLLAHYAGYDKRETEIVEQAALYHDIGKCDIPAALLNKQGALTPQEYAVVKEHTRLGSEKIANALQVLTAAYIMAGQHHERIDGNGYIGLTGNSIHPLARLVAVADVFDALLAQRSYKDAWDKTRVLNYMEGNSGTHFDADIVSILLTHADEFMALYHKHSA